MPPLSATAPTTTGSALELRVTGPDRATVGSEAIFEIHLTNRGTTPLENLEIFDEYDAGLKFPGQPSPIARRLDEPLAAGESRRIGVSFQMVRAGRWCHTVQIRSGDTVLASQGACLDVSGAAVSTQSPAGPPETNNPPAAAVPSATPPSAAIPAAPPTVSTPPAGPVPIGPAKLSLSVTAPAVRDVGKTAEFAFRVTNDTASALTSLKLLTRFDAALEPSMASPGYRWDAGTMYWTIDRLESGQSQEIRVQYLCREPSPQAYSRVKVTSAQSVSAEDEAFVRITGTPQPPAEPLSVKVTDMQDPVTVGKEMTYEVTVTNPGAAPHQGVAVSVELPPQMQVVALQTIGPEVNGRRLGYQAAEQSIRFESLPSLASRTSAVYHVRVQAKTPGDVVVQAQASSNSRPGAAVGQQKTTILAAR